MTSFNNLLTQLTKEIGVLLMLSLFNCRLQNTRLLTMSRISQLEREDHCRGQKIKKNLTQICHLLSLPKTQKMWSKIR